MKGSDVIFIDITAATEKNCNGDLSCHHQNRYGESRKNAGYYEDRDNYSDKYWY